MIAAKMVEVGTDPIALADEADQDRVAGRSVAVRNTGTEPVFLGGQNVDIVEGWTLGPGNDVTFELRASDKLYAVAETGTVIVSVLQVGI